MRIAFDGRTLTAPAGGVRRYVRRLFEALPRVAADVEVVAVGAVPGVDLPVGARAVGARSVLPTTIGRNMATLPLALRRASYDLFHAPAYGAPLWGVRPLVVTIHDVSYERHPEWYPYRIDPVRRAFYRASARRADRVFTDSAFSRDEIVAAYQIDPDRIDVIPLGVGVPFTPDPRLAREPFVLHVGDLHVRRNLVMLLEVVLELRRSDPRLSSLKLVLAGVDRGQLEALTHRAAGSPGSLEYVGCPPDAALADLYRRAAVFAYPSRYEGFGLPALEAMACGTPVVAANAGAVPEVVGDAGILVGVDDGRAWRDAIGAVLTDWSRADEMRQRGPTRARLFTWEATATGTLAGYRRALSSVER